MKYIIVIAFGASALAFAQAKDPAVAAGQQLWGELQAKQTQCAQLTNANFIDLGEYFMDQMMDGAHEAMDQTVLARSGQAGLDAMHLAMGERFSGCNPNAAFPSGMMGYGGYRGPWGWIFMVIFWALIVVGIVVLIQLLIHRKEFGEKKKDLE